MVAACDDTGGSGRTWGMVQQHIERIEVKRQVLLEKLQHAEAAVAARKHLADYLMRIVAVIERVQAGLPAYSYTFDQQRSALLDLA